MVIKRTLELGHHMHIISLIDVVGVALGESLGPRARAHWAHSFVGSYWAHLGDSFNEVIGFIATLAFPGCAVGSVSSSEHRTTKYGPKLIQESIKY